MAYDIEFGGQAYTHVPPATDSLLVPQSEWEELKRLQKDSAKKAPMLLLVAAGISGGGFLSFLAAWISIENESGSGLNKEISLAIALLLAVLTVPLSIFASRAKDVSRTEIVARMSVLETTCHRLNTR